MTDTTMFLWGILFAGIAISYITYGRRQKALVPVLAGIVLFAIPYLISNEYALVVTGIFIMVIPYFIRI